MLSLNLHRRHLNESQRAMVAARIATLPKGANQHTQDPQICGPSSADAAKTLSVGARTVEAAKTVLRDAAPEVVAAVERGDLAVSAAAKVATRTVEEQAAIVNGFLVRRDLALRLRRWALATIRRDALRRVGVGATG